VFHEALGTAHNLYLVIFEQVLQWVNILGKCLCFPFARDINQVPREQDALDVFKRAVAEVPCGLDCKEGICPP
jgi:hypothetical protein